MVRELAMANGFDELSQDEMMVVDGGEIFADYEDANRAALAFAVCALVVSGPLATFYGIMAAYAYYEAATGDYS